MGETAILRELAVIAVLGVAVTALLSRLRFPTVAGLLAAGALLGPHGLGLVTDVKPIETLAELGVVLLLFTIGLEFSFARVRHIFRRVALGGLLQVAGTVAVVAGVATWLGESVERALVYGFVFAQSSTAIVLKSLSERGELDAPHGRFTVATLIFQDLCVIPMVLLVPMLKSGKPGAEAALSIGTAAAQAALVVGAAMLAARYLVPRLLAWVDASRSREVFLLAVISICVGTAWLTSHAGLSLALGAFLGGLVVADSEFQHRAMGDILPLRDVLVSIFFISLGMLFDVRLVLERPLLVLAMLTGFVVGKSILATMAAVMMRFPPRAAWLAGVGLGQFGEFGFVLLQLGTAHGLTDNVVARALLSGGILSMFLTPIAIRLAPHLTAGEALLSPLTRLLGVRGIEQADLDAASDRRGHVVVIGFGMAGRAVARALESCGIGYLVLDLNAETVRKARGQGLPVYYADATSEEALRHAGVGEAREVVILINDPQAARRVVAQVRRVAVEIPILIRTRYLAERRGLLDLGAADVVTEEAEASVEVLTRILRRLEIPRNVIEDHVRSVRDEMRTSDRKITLPRTSLPEHLELADLKIDSVRLGSDANAVGRSAGDLALRTRTGALIVAVRRDKTLLDQPDPTLPLRAGDLVYLAGSSDAIRKATALLQTGKDATQSH